MECCLEAVCEAQTEALLRELPHRYVWRVFGFVMLAQDEVCKMYHAHLGANISTPAQRPHPTTHASSLTTRRETAG